MSVERRRSSKRLLAWGAGAGIVVAGLVLKRTFSTLWTKNSLWDEDFQEQELSVPSRANQLTQLQQTGKSFDVLVIGGGATGSGVALDAVSRGLSTALIERDDFCSGTSSRSTKLVHGGIRYLEKAILGMDYSQWHLVSEALHERATLLRLAPHLSRPLPIMIPVYDIFSLPYMYAGAKMYDFVAGARTLFNSRFLSREETLHSFPTLNPKRLVGSVVYYDGQMNDSRMGLSIALTAAAKGAVVCNHVSAVSLLKEGGRVVGARVRDEQTGKEWDVRATTVVNATGPFTDAILKLDDPNTKSAIVPSAGIHVILPSFLGPSTTGMIIPKTSDGRVLFLLPWENVTLAGTTDRACPVEAQPAPTAEDVSWIITELSKYLSVQVRREDVKAAWAGIRPLAKDPTVSDTASIPRDHVIWSSASGLVSVAGGKWTTYRRMAEETVDFVLRQSRQLKAEPSRTEQLKLIGAQNWKPTADALLAQQFGFSEVVANHLSRNYGSKAFKVAQIATTEALTKPLASEFPILEAEVVYAVENEYACTAVDVLARRTRLAFLDTAAARRALPRVISLMQSRLNWDTKRCEQERAQALQFLETMNVPRN